MSNNTYLDTSVLIEAITDKNRARSEAMHALRRIAKSGQTIIIPQLVIGETFFQIYENSYSDGQRLILDPETLNLNLHKFTELLQWLIPIIKDNTPAFKDGVLELALEIKKEDKDRDLDYCDCIIVSYALFDKESLYLYTTDKGIHNSKIIGQKIKQCKEENGHELRIRDITFS